VEGREAGEEEEEEGEKGEKDRMKSSFAPLQVLMTPPNPHDLCTPPLSTLSLGVRPREFIPRDFPPTCIPPGSIVMMTAVEPVRAAVAASGYDQKQARTLARKFTYACERLSGRPTAVSVSKNGEQEVVGSVAIFSIFFIGRFFVYSLIGL
jgi:hypothetical protein